MKIKLSLMIVLVLLNCFFVGRLDAQQGFQGAVYTMTNATAGNEVLVFHRAADGTLTPGRSFDTGGLGTGSGLGNQGAIVFSHFGRLLFVANAGSDEISVFRIRGNGRLRLRETISSGGRRPISIAVHNDLIYVLNAGGSVGDSDNITGFRVSCGGNLTPIPGSTRPLSAANTGPAQIEFSPDGSLLVVTEKSTNVIDSYTIDEDGLPSNPISNASVGTTPFGFAFGRRDQLFVSEAFGGAPDASALTSYEFAMDGSLQTITPSALTMETAACWVVVTRNGRFAYVTNTGSNTVSGYSVAQDGSLALLNGDGVTANTGPGPIDMSLTRNSQFLYTLNSGNGTISMFAVNQDGSLTSLGPDLAGLPTSSNGLVAN